MMTLAVSGAPDSHSTGVLFFWRAEVVRRTPTALTRFFVPFRTDFVTSVRVSAASAEVLALAGLRPAGARKPQGGAPSPRGAGTSLKFGGQTSPRVQGNPYPKLKTQRILYFVLYLLLTVDR